MPALEPRPLAILTSPTTQIEIDHNLFSSIAEILAAAHDSGTDTIITAPTGHDTITLKGVAAANLQAFDFHLF